MGTTILIDDRYRHRDAPYVSISPKLKRLLLYKLAYELIRKPYGKDFEFVQILTDKDRPKLFWIKPCEAESPGTRKLDRTSTNSRTLSIRALLTTLKWKPAGTVRLLMEWDKEEEAARVDISQASKSK